MITYGVNGCWFNYRSLQFTVSKGLRQIHHRHEILPLTKKKEIFLPDLFIYFFWLRLFMFIITALTLDFDKNAAIFVKICHKCKQGYFQNPQSITLLALFVIKNWEPAKTIRVQFCKFFWKNVALAFRWAFRTNEYSKVHQFRFLDKEWSLGNDYNPSRRPSYYRKGIFAYFFVHIVASICETRFFPKNSILFDWSKKL